MEENPPRVSRKHHNGTREEEGTSSSSRVRGPTTRRMVKSRFYTVDDHDDDNESGSGDGIECSGKYCGSCTGELIADCVAICCCPCALINLLIFAFVKVPWMVGRKCLRKVVKKNKRSRSRNMEMTKRSSKCKIISSSDDDKKKEDDDGGNLRKGKAKDGILELFGDHEDQEEIVMSRIDIGSGSGTISARFEAERVWLELYKDCHLGFGRVSFTGIQ